MPITTSDIQELNIDDLNEYREDRALLLTENEEGYWRKLTLDPNKSVTGTGYPFAYQNNEIISASNIDRSFVERSASGTQYVDTFTDFSSGIPTWGLQTSDSATYRWEPDDRRETTGESPQISTNSKGEAWLIDHRTSGGGNPADILVIYNVPPANTWNHFFILDTQQAPSPTPDIALSESGVAIATWVHDTGLSRVIYASSYDPVTKTWAANSELSFPTATEDSSPRITIDDVGNGLVVWSSTQGDGSISIYGSRFTQATQTWDGVPTIIRSGNDNVDPSVKMDSSGDAVAIWEHDDGALSWIESSTYIIGTNTWSVPIIISGNTANAVHPELSVASNGTAMAVWLDDSGGLQYFLNANKYDKTSQTWNPFPYNIDSLSSNQNPAKIAMSDVGTAMVIFSDQVSGVSGQYYIETSHYDPDADAWNPSVILDQTTVANPKTDININDSGDAVAIWVKEAATDFALFSATYQELIKKWSLPDQISVEREAFTTTQVVVEGSRAASIYQGTSNGSSRRITGTVGSINPHIITANDSIVSFSFRKIQEVGEPEVATDAATKFYVDNAIAAATGVFLEQLQSQDLLKEGALEALNKKEVKKISKKKGKINDNK